jgi:hypothetical protein
VLQVFVVFGLAVHVAPPHGLLQGRREGRHQGPGARPVQDILLQADNAIVRCGVWGAGEQVLSSVTCRRVLAIGRQHGLIITDLAPSMAVVADGCLHVALRQVSWSHLQGRGEQDDETSLYAAASTPRAAIAGFLMKSP